MYKYLHICTYLRTSSDEEFIPDYCEASKDVSVGVGTKVADGTIPVEVTDFVGVTVTSRVAVEEVTSACDVRT